MQNMGRGSLCGCRRPCFHPLLPLPVVHVLAAPYFHPTSSCSWRRLGVLWWWSSSSPRRRGCRAVGVLGRPCCPCPIRCRCHCRFRFRFRCPPPRFTPLSLPLPRHRCRCSARSPPPLSSLFPVFTPEATAAGVTRAVVVPHDPPLILLLSVLAPPSTLRAVARGGGGKCWDVPVVPLSSSPSLLWSLSLPCPFPVPIIPVLR